MIKLYCIMILAFTFALGCPLYAQEQDNLQAKIERLLEATRVNERFEAVTQKMIELQRENYGEYLDTQYWEELEREMFINGYRELTDSLVRIYQKHLGMDEIDAALEFYESKAGQKLVTAFSAISSESMKVGEKYGELLSRRIETKIQGQRENKFNQMADGCLAIHEGSFSTELNDGSVAYIIRKGGTQTERLEEQVDVYEIEWITDCTYKIYTLDEEKNRLAENVLEVNIYEIEGDIVRYVYRLEGGDSYGEGQMRMIE